MGVASARTGAHLHLDHCHVHLWVRPYYRFARHPFAVRRPHIVGVHDRGGYEGRLWISMDYVDGVDGARLLADRYPSGMPLEEKNPVPTGRYGRDGDAFWWPLASAALSSASAAACAA